MDQNTKTTTPAETFKSYFELAMGYSLVALVGSLIAILLFGFDVWYAKVSLFFSTIVKYATYAGLAYVAFKIFWPFIRSFVLLIASLFLLAAMLKYGI